MKIDKKKLFTEMLYLEAKTYGFELNDSVLKKLEIYKNMLIEWNEKMNLTSITDEYQIIVKHFIDSLECTKYIKENDNIIDIGTGAGFPGIVIAIWFEGKVNITLLDSTNKRLIFIDEVIKALDLKNINIVHGRAEDKANDSLYREVYDIAVARALAPLNILCEYTSPYIKVKGKCIYMKGDNLQEEIEQAKNAFKTLNLRVLNIYKYNLEVLQNEVTEVFNRSILEVEKINKTSNIYPRSYGKMKISPL